MARAFDLIRWSAGALYWRAPIVIQRLDFSHVTCIKINFVELSPTRRKLKYGIWFIRCDVFRGLIIPSDKRKAIHIINYISKYKYVTSYRVGAAWARVALPRGPECHVASTCVPRENINPFLYFKIIFNHFRSKRNPEKIQKNP